MKSLRLRLIIFFSAIAVVVWLVTSAIAYFKARHTLDELFDTQQILFAKSLAYADLSVLFQGKSLKLPKTSRLVWEDDIGEEDDDALAFAVFSSDGQMFLSDGDKGQFIPFNAARNGFVDGYLQIGGDSDRWRLFYLASEDSRFRVVVGQELEFRQEMALDIIWGVLLPWLVILPLLLIAIIWLIRRELSSLRAVAKELPNRDPGDAMPIAVDRVPSEVQPLVRALNGLFLRISDTLARERRFTADASHELRTPLAALRVQAEVAQIAGDDEAVRAHALDQLIVGIDRSTRLVEQLLALSRLDSLRGIQDMAPVNWRAIVETAFTEVKPLADKRRIALRFEEGSSPPELNGNFVLLTLLMRNLVGNAVRYIHDGGEIVVRLSRSELRVDDNGPGVAPEYLSSLEERFFRPPGQQQSGSGLGLSIVGRIAQLHGFGFRVANRAEGGFSAVVSFSA